ncbi:MAG: type I DNA topoisomerase [Myxococcales bacterium]|nr:type I DNA topoisomerase [Myxococcales bacterium]MCB9521387.1 type I DNA topoisomerase [Myxococcales bacterium]MCB9533798.1 type I DNA topoisomerase [Myxococcales bacterium]
MSSGQKLVIVESPTKAKTIRQFLGPGYRVEASMGHVRDLPSNADEIPDSIRGEKWARLGVDVTKDFEPVYIVPEDKKKVVAALKKALKDVDELYLATDEDREGESIAWHLSEVLKPKVPTRRMVFHEITRDAIGKALGSSRMIDQRLVAAQETRRVIDRLVGFEVSRLLWQKVAQGLSAGRVQSVAVRMLVLRERERMAFHSGSYWNLDASLRGSFPFTAQLSSLAGRSIATGRDFDETTGKLLPNRDVLLLDERTARELAADLREQPFVVASVDRREATRSPSPPFTTSTLQQEANRKLGLSARDTMSVAQRLYENGYITYMRTDSVHLSDEAIGAARGLVERRFGADHLAPGPRQFSTTTKGAQEAHEAIRPAGTEMPDAKQLGLRGPEAKLYELIWMRTVATQMADARIALTTATLRATDSEGRAADFRASGREVLFPGFFRAYVESSDDPEAALDDQSKPLPRLDEGKRVDCDALDAAGHETKPPARYTEATLVKALEKEGIGRPSTYATIIDTIKTRGYVFAKAKQLIPTFTAFAVTSLLEQTHAQIVDTDFTAGMEQDLDALGERVSAREFLSAFYSGVVLDGISRGKDIHPRDVCTVEVPGANFAVRVGRYGPYVEREVDGEKVTVSIPDSTPPADVTQELVDGLSAQRASADAPIGEDPRTGLPIYVLSGRFGPYVQLGPTPDDGTKPRRASLPKGMSVGDVTLEKAAGLLSLPRELGTHPDSGSVITADVGRYGPYVKHDKTYASLERGDDVLSVSLDRALELLALKERKGGAAREALRDLGPHPSDGKPMAVYDGKFGPYVKHGKINASLPRGASVEALSVEEAVALLEARAAAPKKSRPTTTRRKKS